MDKYTLELKYHFDAAHKLDLGYSSPCQQLHGHRWEVKVKIVSSVLNKDGMIVDFQTIKNIINELDHRYLNDIMSFNPTAENIARYLYYKIKEKVLGEVSITIWESPGASIIYGREEDQNK